MDVPQTIKCPECGGHSVFKDGLRYPKEGSPIQRFLCRTCGFRFSEHNSNKECQIISNRRICAVLQEAKNLTTTTETKTVAGEGKTTSDLKGKIVEFAWYLKKQNYSEDTLIIYVNSLKNLIGAKADIANPESVKEILAQMKCGEARKHVIIAAYTLFLKTQGLTWNPPMCKVNRKLPFIPTERELDDLIAACGRKMAVLLQLLKETAMRIGEASELTWNDMDLQRRNITLNNPEKNGNPRIFTVSPKLVDMLAALPKNTDYVFGTPCKRTRSPTFYKKRRAVAEKLKNPRLLRIGFHTFRHWKATMLYHETKDVLQVKELLGHKSLDTTLLYIQLEKALFQNESNEFIVKTAKEPKEIQELLEVGFEYVCQTEDMLYFRKRK